MFPPPALVVRYYSATQKSMVTTFVALIELDDGMAAAIVKALKNLLARVGLDPKRLLGIGVDNASVNMGVNNGVFETLKREWQLPNLVMVRCICHSLQLALSHSVQGTLPRNADFLVRETHMWFSHSSKRKAAYSQLYKSLCDGGEPLAIPRVCDTRWISPSSWIAQNCLSRPELSSAFQPLTSFATMETNLKYCLKNHLFTF